MPASQPVSTFRLPLFPALALALTVLATSSLLDHFQPPTGLMLTPVVVPVAGWLLAFSRLRQPVVKAGLTAALISLYDCSIKLYGGAMHDNAGQGFMHAGLLLGSLVAFVILVAALDQDLCYSRRTRRLAKALFVALLLLHLTLTANLGLGRCIGCY